VTWKVAPVPLPLVDPCAVGADGSTVQEPAVDTVTVATAVTDKVATVRTGYVEHVPPVRVTVSLTAYPAPPAALTALAAVANALNMTRLVDGVRPPPQAVTMPLTEVTFCDVQETPGVVWLTKYPPSLLMPPAPAVAL